MLHMDATTPKALQAGAHGKHRLEKSKFSRHCVARTAGHGSGVRASTDAGPSRRSHLRHPRAGGVRSARPREFGGDPAKHHWRTKTPLALWLRPRSRITARPVTALASEHASDAAPARLDCRSTECRNLRGSRPPNPGAFGAGRRDDGKIRLPVAGCPIRYSLLAFFCQSYPRSLPLAYTVRSHPTDIDWGAGRCGWNRPWPPEIINAPGEYGVDNPPSAYHAGSMSST